MFINLLAVFLAMEFEQGCIKYDSLENASRELLNWKINGEIRGIPKSPLTLDMRINYLEDNGYIYSLGTKDNLKSSMAFKYHPTEEGIKWAIKD